MHAWMNAQLKLFHPDMDVPDELQEWISLNEEAENHPNIVAQIDALKDSSCVDPNADQ